MNKINVQIVVMCLVIGAVFGLAITNETPMKQVYRVCNESRTNVGINETECGELQDKYSLEFVCKQANRESNNECWVETI